MQFYYLIADIFYRNAHTPQPGEIVFKVHVFIFIYLFGVLRRFQHCTGHITTGSWKGRGNQYIQLVKVLYCKLPTNRKQLPALPLEAVPGTEPRPQRWEARVLPLCHRGPLKVYVKIKYENKTIQ